MDLLSSCGSRTFSMDQDDFAALFEDVDDFVANDVDVVINEGEEEINIHDLLGGYSDNRQYQEAANSPETNLEARANLAQKDTEEEDQGQRNGDNHSVHDTHSENSSVEEEDTTNSANKNNNTTKLFSGMVFAICGTSRTRERGDLVALLEGCGGIVKDSITKHVTHLVCCSSSDTVERLRGILTVLVESDVVQMIQDNNNTNNKKRELKDATTTTRQDIDETIHIDGHNNDDDNDNGKEEEDDGNDSDDDALSIQSFGEEVDEQREEDVDVDNEGLHGQDQDDISLIGDDEIVDLTEEEDNEEDDDDDNDSGDNSEHNRNREEDEEDEEQEEAGHGSMESDDNDDSDSDHNNHDGCENNGCSTYAHDEATHKRQCSSGEGETQSLKRKSFFHEIINSNIRICAFKDEYDFFANHKLWNFNEKKLFGDQGKTLDRIPDWEASFVDLWVELEEFGATAAATDDGPAKKRLRMAPNTLSNHATASRFLCAS